MRLAITRTPLHVYFDYFLFYIDMMYFLRPPVYLSNSPPTASQIESAISQPLTTIPPTPPTPLTPHFSTIYPSHQFLPPIYHPLPTSSHSSIMDYPPTPKQTSTRHLPPIAPLLNIQRHVQHPKRKTSPMHGR